MMMDIGRVLNFIAMCVTVVCAGCATQLPTDLEVASLTLVKVPTRTGRELDNGRYVTGDGTFFRFNLDFTSVSDLQKYAKTSKTLLDVDAYLCARPEHRVLITRGPIRWKEHEMGGYQESHELPIVQDETGRFTYSQYLSVYSPPVPAPQSSSNGTAKNKYEAYDLKETPEDVCLVVVSRGMFHSARSNVMRVSKDLIQERLKTLNRSE